MVIPKGAKMSEEDKKKVEAMKKKGATRSQMAKVRMNVLMGVPFAKAKRMAMSDNPKAKKTMPEVQEVVVEEVS